MTNFEKYRDEILNFIANNEYERIAIVDGKFIACKDACCGRCEFNRDKYEELSCSNRRLLWLYEEYQEPTVDWSTVPIDTKVLVSNSGNYWCKRYFAKRKDGKYYTWYQGATSWSNDRMEAWDYAKLAEEDAE